MNVKKIYTSTCDFFTRFFMPSLKGCLVLLICGVGIYLLLPLYQECIDNTIVVYNDKYFHNSIGLAIVLLITIVLSGIYICKKLLKICQYPIRWGYIYSLIGILCIWVYYRFINKVWTFENLFGTVISYVDLLALLVLSIVVCTIIVNLRLYKKRYGSNSTDTEDDSLHLISDAPIQNEDNDNFFRNTFALTMSKVVMGLDISECSYSLAVTAPWGHGKTSFINLFEKALKKRHAIVIRDIQ